MGTASKLTVASFVMTVATVLYCGCRTSNAPKAEQDLNRSTDEYFELTIELKETLSRTCLDSSILLQHLSVFRQHLQTGGLETNPEGVLIPTAVERYRQEGVRVRQNTDYGTLELALEAETFRLLALRDDERFEAGTLFWEGVAADTGEDFVAFSFNQSNCDDDVVMAVELNSAGERDLRPEVFFVEWGKIRTAD